MSLQSQRAAETGPRSFGAGPAPRSTAFRWLTMLLSGYAALATSIVSAADRSPGGSAPAIVIHNVHGYSPTESGDTHFGWLSIDGQGLITATGTGTPPNGARMVDGNDQYLLPGLIDAHGHVASLGLAMAQIDLVGADSLAETLQRVADYADDHPGDDWLLGRGWNQEHWQPAKFPTADDLDRVVGNRPTVLGRVDGHAAWLNRAALAAAGITDDTPDPQGGMILRDSDGKATGILVDTAQALAGAQIPAPSNQRLQDALSVATALVVSQGMTFVHDAGVSIDGVRAWQALAAAGEMPMRAHVMLAGIETQRIFGEPWTSSNGQLTVRSIKLVADGALGSRGAALLAPYADADHTGLMITPGPELMAVIGEARAAEFQVNVHAIGDRANQEALDAFETAGARPSERHRIEHAQIVSLADIPRFAALGIIPSMQSTHATSDKNMAVKRLGTRRLAGAYAWRRFLDQGSRIANGSDFPVEPPNPFLGLYAAITRQDLIGEPAGGWFPDQKMTRAEALRSFTLDAAFAAFADKETGSIEPGKAADFIIIDQDFMTVAPAEIPKTRVLQTWVGGRQVYSASK